MLICIIIYCLILKGNANKKTSIFSKKPEQVILLFLERKISSIRRTLGCFSICMYWRTLWLCNVCKTVTGDAWLYVIVGEGKNQKIQCVQKSENSFSFKIILNSYVTIWKCTPCRLLKNGLQLTLRTWFMLQKSVHLVHVLSLDI